MKRQIKGLALCLCIILLVAGCSKTDTSNVTLGEYKGLTVAKAATEPTEEALAEYIHSVIDQYSTPPMITDRAVADGDTVNIDFVGLRDGEPFEGGTDTGSNLTIGSGSFIPGFEEGLVGAMPGTQVDLDVTFPEDYHQADLAGVAVVFEVKVNYIVGEGHGTHPDVTDAWVKETLEYDSIDAWHAALREELRTELESSAEATEWNTLVDTILENATFGSLPEERVNSEIEANRVSYENYAAYFGMDLDSLIAAFGMTPEEFEAELRTVAEDYVRKNLVFLKIAEVEKITMTAEEKDTYSQNYGYDSFAHFAESYDPAVITEVLLADKVGDFLLENNTFA